MTSLVAGNSLLWVDWRHPSEEKLPIGKAPNDGHSRSLLTIPIAEV